MKLLYINHKNANQLLSYSKKSPLIVKYYSPTCGACIGMQGEWEKLCNDLEKNYHGEVVVASVDPSGRDALDKYDIHTDIDGYPTILYLDKGKKISEFEGPRTHKHMLKWIGGYKLIKKKQNGGRKQKTKRIKKGRGIGQSKPIKPPTPPIPPTKTRKNVTFSPNTKAPSSPKQNKTKKFFMSKNKERQKAVVQYEKRKHDQELRDMMLGKIPLNGGRKNKNTRKTMKKKTLRKHRGIVFGNN